MTSSMSASAVKIQGVHLYPMKASGVPETSNQSRWAAQATAAGAVIARRPAMMPMSSVRTVVTSIPPFRCVFIALSGKQDGEPHRNDALCAARLAKAAGQSRMKSSRSAFMLSGWVVHMP